MQGVWKWTLLDTESVCEYLQQIYYNSCTYFSHVLLMKSLLQIIIDSKFVNFSNKKININKNYCILCSYYISK